VNWITNDDIHQSSKVISKDKDIHLLSGVAREKVGDLLLNMCSIPPSNSYESIVKCIMGYYMFIPAKAPKQMGT
jgi:hypothetical protein